MSDSASVALDFEADASDALLLWIDPLGADALDFSLSVDGFDRQAHKSPASDSRPHGFGFGEGPPSSEPPTWLAIAGATLRGAVASPTNFSAQHALASDRGRAVDASGHTEERGTTSAGPSVLDDEFAPEVAHLFCAADCDRGFAPEVVEPDGAAAEARGFSSERGRGKASCIAPSDARTQGGFRSGATGADRGRSSAKRRVPTDVRGGEGSGLKKAPVQNPGPEQEDLQFSSKARSGCSPSW